jgi:hypothetical protein
MQSLSDAHACAHPPFSVTCHGISVTCDDNNEFVNENATEAESPAVSGRSRHGAAGGEAAGLVSSQTSGMRGLSHSTRKALIRSVERLGDPKKVPLDAVEIDPEATRLSRLKTTVLTAARLHGQQTRKRWKCLMLTLTYDPKRAKWEAGQISDLIRHIRFYLKRRGVPMRFVWVQEFTKKGAPHYHVLIWLPFGRSLPMPDKQGWWPYGMTKIEWVRHAVGYIAKYASKADSLHRPEKGARIHGNGGLTDEALLEQRWWKLPAWLRSDVEPSDRLRRAPTGTGGGFVHPGTGERYISPWEVFFSAGRVYIKRRGVQ